MNGQRNLTKLQLSTEDFIQKLDFLTEEQKKTMVDAQSKAEEMSERAAKLDKFTALKLAQQNSFVFKVEKDLSEPEKKLMEDIISGRELKPQVPQVNSKFLAVNRARPNMPVSSNLPQDKTKLANNLLKIYLESKKEFI